jgi:hypothetical protein
MSEIKPKALVIRLEEPPLMPEIKAQNSRNTLNVFIFESILNEIVIKIN